MAAACRSFPQDPQMGCEKVRTKSEVAGIPQNGILENRYMFLRNSQIQGGVKNLKTSLPMVVLVVTMRRYYFNALGISISVQREMQWNLGKLVY